LHRNKQQTEESRGCVISALASLLIVPANVVRAVRAGAVDLCVGILCATPPLAHNVMLRLVATLSVLAAADASDGAAARAGELGAVEAAVGLLRRYPALPEDVQQVAWQLLWTLLVPRAPANVGRAWRAGALPLAQAALGVQGGWQEHTRQRMVELIELLRTFAVDAEAAADAAAAELLADEGAGAQAAQAATKRKPKSKSKKRSGAKPAAGTAEAAPEDEAAAEEDAVAAPPEPLAAAADVAAAGASGDAPANSDWVFPSLPVAATPPPPPPSPAAPPSRTAPRPYRPPMGVASPAASSGLFPPASSCAAAAAAALPLQLAALAVGGDAVAQLPATPLPAPALATSQLMRECCICLADVALSDLLILFPCAHRCVYQGCADALMAGSRRCPKCREGVEHACRVYED
jgi:hypothetical protein